MDIIRYESRKSTDLTEADIKACSDLFSTSYGMYDMNSPIRPGEQIRMGVKHYREKYCKDGFFLVRAMDGDKQVGHAWYIRRRYDPYGTMTWVLQLVVDRQYRRRGIASTLLHSIWGFSDDFAWGLASANPCTVKTLESATFRKCNTRFISKNIDAIRMIGKDTTFVRDDAYLVGNKVSQVDTAFFADNSDYSKDMECEEYLGELQPGYEWLAFTFREQKINTEKYRKHFTRMMSGYENILRDAYGRMNAAEHRWAKGTANEVEFIRKHIPKNGAILDMGCGTGRHAVALAKNGYQVTAVDNASVLFEKAKNDNKDISNLNFVSGDVRYLEEKNKYDAVICLFDVVGSYPKVNDNVKIIKSAYESLKRNGILIVSVMNMELTESLIKDKNKGVIRRKPNILGDLPPSSTMQKSGAIFDADYLALDTERSLIYRKEQFDNDNGLPAEYIIRDKRYTVREISNLVEKVGFSILDARYVQAGHFDIRLEAKDIKAKEICIVCRKI